MLQIRGGDDLMTLSDHTGKVKTKNHFTQSLENIKDGLKATLILVYPMYKLQTAKAFRTGTEQAMMYQLVNYTSERAAGEALAMQTSSTRKKDETLVRLRYILETTDKQAASTSQNEPVNSVKTSHKTYKKFAWDKCGFEKGKAHRSESYPAKGKKCVICRQNGHFAKAKICNGKGPVATDEKYPRIKYWIMIRDRSDHNEV
ncbi:Hypothetical predicted protein [Octopus vulgaris]|uniref:Uncharacterized protein n=1 Tax=Octopus vulgaris TaxID=6645 RepID=A0AA36BQG8_OCTVU|nr:Hypothetical predicted protein [Octopus vulgaris]